jgi:acyl-homoserine lactone acylase PvdQ
MQLDIYSRYAYEMKQIILPVLNESQDFLNLKEKTALRKLKNWDCMMTGNKTAPTIFNSLVLNLIYKTFHDELGDELFLDYTYNSTFSYNRILELLQSNSTLFFDNKNTKTIENSRYIIFQSFRDALTYIEEYSGKIETEGWFWVNFHKVILAHPLEENKHLRSIYSTTPIGIGGNWSTINYSNWEFRKPFTVKSGAAIRFISDMRDDAIYCIMPGGISGDPTNIHFSNQLRIWANGGYFKLIHSHKKINSSNSRNIIPE